MLWPLQASLIALYNTMAVFISLLMIGLLYSIGLRQSQYLKAWKVILLGDIHVNLHAHARKHCDHIPKLAIVIHSHRQNLVYLAEIKRNTELQNTQDKTETTFAWACTYHPYAIMIINNMLHTIMLNVLHQYTIYNYKTNI